jgi:hypothetical protein
MPSIFPKSRIGEPEQAQIERADAADEQAEAREVEALHDRPGPCRRHESVDRRLR